MDKKIKKICLNLTEAQYKEIEQRAKKQERNITNYCYLLITKTLKEQ